MTGVYKLRQDLPVESGASFFINPYTAVGIVDTAKREGHRAFVHTGAASQLGQMLVKLCARPAHKMSIVNVVRRAEQAEALRAIGAEHVVVTAEADWEEQLRALVKQLKVRLAFECVAGEMSGKIVSLLPPKSTTYIYGRLSGGTVDGIVATDLIYFEKKVRGWLLPLWLRRGSLLRQWWRVRAVTKLVNSGLGAGGWAESRFLDTTMEDAFGAFLKQHEEGGTATDAKLRLRFV